MNFNPHKYQLETIEFINDNPKSMVILDMGLGKTVSTLTAMSELLDQTMIKNILVIAPLRVAKYVWPAEIEKWDHLKRISYSLILGTKQARISAIRKKADIHMINRENIPDLISTVGKNGWKWDCIVVDESTSFKNPKSKRFRALKLALPLIDRVILLTGTPIPNGYLDLWSQIFLVDSGKRLGKSYQGFYDQYFYSMNFKDVLKPRSASEIMAKIKDVTFSIDKKDHVKLPERVEIDEKVELPEFEMMKYNQLKESLFTEINGKVITAANSQAIITKLQQAANGSIYDHEGKDNLLHDAKIEALQEIIEAVPDENIIVAYQFISDKNRINAKYPTAIDIREEGAIDQWNKGKIKILTAHPASAGHGLNLQSGGNRIIWFGLPWALELWLQMNARIHRQGQEKPVFIHKIIAKGTIDETMNKSLIGGKQLTQNEFLKSITEVN